jgi:Fe-Mn family superoxide dismutase
MAANAAGTGKCRKNPDRLRDCKPGKRRPDQMAFKLPSLPYATNALEPHISQRTMEFHHGKHHQTYVTTLNELIEGKPYAKMTLEDIILKSAAKSEDRAIFNNAAQVWNHTAFWNSLQPGGGGEPGGEVAGRLQEAFGSYSGFRQAFIAAAVGQFGSGWTWLVQNGRKLAVISTPDALNPLVSGQAPLLACDVWEHAYYLDYQNRRKAFVEAFLDHLVNWDTVASALFEAEAKQARKSARATAGRR